MGRDESLTPLVTPERVQEYLQRHGYPDARLCALQPIGADTSGDLKAYGYGRPLCAVFETQGKTERLVIRTMSPDPFGHSRRADRAYQMLLSYDTFGTIPRHIQPRDAGGFSAQGEMLSVPCGEFFLVTEYVDGELYANDLKALCDKDDAPELARARAAALASYLADLHRRPADLSVYATHLRDTVGSGEGILGQIDGYPKDDPVATPERLQAIELSVARWRWLLRDRHPAPCVTHGDFHPFNILFREGTDFSVLDCSRGGVGTAADDITCLSVNYMFFALRARGSFTGALRELWKVFWQTYLRETNHTDILRSLCLHFTWRMLVLASPVWYPSQDRLLREALLRFCERLLAGERFDPNAPFLLEGPAP
jgi:aminoglycoside phosphotransferase (APT) family kinase protein